MAEWLVEQGIGETRAIRIEGGRAVAARLEWPGSLRAGTVEEAVLVARTAGSRRGTARFACGEETLVDQLPREASEGAALRLKIHRARIAERGRNKLAQARPTADLVGPAPSLTDAPGGRTVPAFPAGLWEELFAEAWDGEAAFSGGSITLSPTPAMTLIDVDGTLPAPALARAAVPMIAASIARMDLAGSIGIDFPTLADRSDRHALDAALGSALAGWPHERTAINGFGFVQLVARLERPSLPALIAGDRPRAASRLLLRQAEAVAAPGAILLCARPEVCARISGDDQAELARRTGRTIRIEPDPALALGGGFAQAIPA